MRVRTLAIEIRSGLTGYVGYVYSNSTSVDVELSSMIEYLYMYTCYIKLKTARLACNSASLSTIAMQSNID